VAQAGFYAPEAQLGTLPLVVGFLNGVVSMIRDGLVNDPGFGGWNLGLRRQRISGNVNPPDGSLTFRPRNATSAAAAVAELNLLLTGGRLSADSLAIIEAAYSRELAEGGPAAALKLAQQLIVTTSAFTATNDPSVRPVAAKPLPPQPSLGRPYKAIVVVYLAGGADTYNMLMPHGGCTGASADLVNEYRLARDVAAVPRSSTLPIQVPNGTQPCTTFGVNGRMPRVKQLYDDGDAAFFANIGALIEPVSKEAHDAGTVRLPPSLYGHNTQDEAAWTLHPQNLNANGLLGRIANALDSQGTEAAPPLKTSIFSLDGG
jgi:cullin-associated NEDD8-dissociated protein 1